MPSSCLVRITPATVLHVWDLVYLCFTDGTISRFFNDPVVLESLNTPSDHGFWSACVPGAGRRRLEGKIVLDNDKPLSVVPYIAELLDEFNMDILMYNGDL